MSPVVCLEGFIQLGHNVKNNYKIDEMTVRHDLQRKLKGLGFIRSQGRWPRGVTVSSHIKVAVWSMTKCQSSLQFRLEEGYCT